MLMAETSISQGFVWLHKILEGSRLAALGVRAMCSTLFGLLPGVFGLGTLDPKAFGASC